MVAGAGAGDGGRCRGAVHPARARVPVPVAAGSPSADGSAWLLLFASQAFPERFVANDVRRSLRFAVSEHQAL